MRQRPWLTKLLAVQRQLATQKSCPELDATIQAHQALDRALENARSPNATFEKEGIGAQAQLVLTYLAADAGFEEPVGVPETLGGPRGTWVAPHAVQLGEFWLLEAEWNRAAAARWELSDLLKLHTLLAGSFFNVRSKLAHLLHMVGLLVEAVADPKHIARHTAQLQALRLPLTLRQLEQALLALQYTCLWELGHTAQRPVDLKEQLDRVTQRMLELGARPSRAYHDRALVKESLFNDYKEAYKYYLLGRWAAEQSQQASLQAYCCYGAAACLLLGGAGPTCREKQVMQLLEEAQACEQVVRPWAREKMVRALDNGRCKAEQLLRIARQWSPPAALEKGQLAAVSIAAPPTPKSHLIQSSKGLQHQVCTGCGELLQLARSRCGGQDGSWFCSKSCRSRWAQLCGQKRASSSTPRAGTPKGSTPKSGTPNGDTPTFKGKGNANADVALSAPKQVWNAELSFTSLASDK